MKNVINRTTCRICGNPHLTTILDLGDMYLQGLFVKDGYIKPPERKVPLKLMFCDPTKNETACGLVQLSNTISQNILYSTYWYRSGTNTTMRNHLKDIVDLSLKYLKNISYDHKSVLDIGCNDGTMLSFYPKDIIKYGVDPSNSIDEIKDISIKKMKDVYPNDNIKNSKFHCITSVAMLYDLEDPLSFVSEICNNLTDTGIWVFEMSYLPSMLKMNAFDTICNEHIEYYSLSVIETMLEWYNMKLINATLNDTNGGSIQCIAVKKSCLLHPINSENLNKLRTLEFEMEIDNMTPYIAFRDRVEKITTSLSKLLTTYKEEGKEIHLYGASTKGNTLLQACKLNNEIISYAADRNPDKWGAKTLGTNIPIISEEESRKMRPDVYLVLPWHFKNEFLEREKETIENGAIFVFPLPEITIVKKSENGLISEINYTGE
jgi:hypothetical protein